MGKKPSLSFYTNIPTPYQISFFRELSKLFELHVIFYSKSEGERMWRFSLKNESFKCIFLKNNIIAKFIQKWVSDFHFSWQIFSTAWKDKSEFVIVGGAYWIPNAFSALIFSRLKSKKVMFFSEPLFDDHNEIKYLFKWLVLRVVNICCDGILCVGNKAVESFNRYGISCPKFFVPYNINPDTFVNLDQEKISQIKKKYNDGDDILLISSGSLIHRKGMDVLVKAIKQSKLDGFRLLILGEGSQREELISLIGDDSRIILAGFQHPNDLPYFFAIADIFVFASRYDGWAVVINEAIAANLPIICSKSVGAAVELITSSDLGLMCEPDEVLAFKEAIESLVTDEGKRNEIKENAKLLIPLISSSHNAQRVYNIYRYEIS